MTTQWLPAIQMKMFRRFVQIMILVLLFSTKSFGGIGFNGMSVPLTLNSCGGSITITPTVSTCINSGSDWTATYFIDSSHNMGATWFTPFGTTTGVVGSSFPALTYITPPLSVPYSYPICYRIRLVGITNNCLSPGTTFTSLTMSVNVAPATNTITVSGNICESSTTLLSGSSPGGTWTSSTPSVATIDGYGNVTGVSPGIDTIRYILTPMCYAVKTINVLSPSPPITGPLSLCSGSSYSYTNTSSGGTWSVSGWGYTTIGTSTGVLYASTIGTTYVSYTPSALGTCTTTLAVTVDPAPAAIGGIAAICAGASATLTDAVADGTWSSDNLSVATVDPVTGHVSGIAAGTVNISYSLSTCSPAVGVVTVNTIPIISISDPHICQGITDTFSGSPTGGSWTSSYAGDPISSVGVLNPVWSGIVTISYALPTSCHAMQVITVNASPGTIGGISSMCAGQTYGFFDGTPGGTWSSSDVSVAAIGSLGDANAIMAGTTTISYTLTSTGCPARINLTVNPLPDTITGSLFICPGLTATLSDSTEGGTWICSPAAIATIDATSGAITGIAPGTTHITYTISTGCRTGMIFTVTPTPYAGIISGSTMICPGNSAPFIATVPGGTWSSSDASIAAVSASGVVTGISVGAAIINYEVATDCGVDTVSSYATAIVTIDPMTVHAGVISGADTICKTMGITLTDAVSGGTWLTSDPSIATVSPTGFVIAVSPGAATIWYTITGLCMSDSASHLLTVSPCDADMIIQLATENDILTLFPNPTHDEIHFNAPGLDKGYSIIITDAMGRAMIREEHSASSVQSHIHDLKNVPPGNYIIRLNTGTNSYRGKITIW